MKNAIALIIFNRPHTTQRVFNAIREAKPAKLFVIADGIRQHCPDDVEKCAATRKIIEQADWDCEILCNYSETNLGTKKRVSSGLDWVFAQVETAIILEDDCLPHPHFFPFCEELLEYFDNDARIMTISGNNFQFAQSKKSHSQRHEYSYYFSRYPLIWGWATWRRAWQKYDLAMQHWEIIRDGKWLQDLLDDHRAVKYWSRIFQKCYQGNLDTWDYAWTFTSWLQNSLSIIPNTNLVTNIGFSPNALNSKAVNSLFDNHPTNAISFPLKHPPFIIRDTQADKFTQSTQFDPSLNWRIKMKLRQIWNV
ncbi:methyltransferase FkbM [Calothrix sp. NIES-4101]|nr:methyltransferase FkbM [Calothrix sp. NIES-4101]